MRPNWPPVKSGVRVERLERGLEMGCSEETLYRVSIEGLESLLRRCGWVERGCVFEIVWEERV
ncbi:hypothetical protein [Aeropyrum pernix]|uniref:hypothetical protein n=1 Tax=Aeropyrum pernix TaxID=56636 RepID=UPI001036FB3D|nr:hypothetical protein [Aeropyrum pernix]